MCAVASAVSGASAISSASATTAATAADVDPQGDITTRLLGRAELYASVQALNPDF